MQSRKNDFWQPMREIYVLIWVAMSFSSSPYILNSSFQVINPIKQTFISWFISLIAHILRLEQSNERSCQCVSYTFNETIELDFMCDISFYPFLVYFVQ
jgi:hypothetical protein